MEYLLFFNSGCLEFGIRWMLQLIWWAWKREIWTVAYVGCSQVCFRNSLIPQCS